MGKPVNDFRMVLNDFVMRVLKAEAAGRGEDQQVIAREVFEKWAQQRHRAHRVYAKALRADGLQMELDGLETGEDGGGSK